MLRVDSSRDQIDRSLVGGQVALWWASKTDGTVDDDLAVVVDEVAQLWNWKDAAVLGGSPEHHLVADEDAELLFQLVSWFRQAAGDCHHRAGE